MATKCIINKSTMTGIADAIRAKGGTTGLMKPGEMAGAIEALPSGGITSPIWDQPADWPRIDLVDPRRDTGYTSVQYFLCKYDFDDDAFGIYSLKGVKRYFVDEVEILADGNVRHISGTEKTVTGVESYIFEAVPRSGFHCFRVRSDSEVSITGNVSTNPLLGIVSRYDFSNALYIPCVTVTSGNYQPRVRYVRYVDGILITNAYFSWRGTQSLSCLVFDGCVVNGIFGRSFENTANLTRVVFCNGGKFLFQNTSAGPVGLLGNSRFATIDESCLDFGSITNYDYFCQNWNAVIRLDFSRSHTENSHPTVLTNAFYGAGQCVYMDLSTFDFSRVTSINTTTFSNNYNLKYLRMPPFGKGLNVSHRWSLSTRLTHDSLLSILDSLGDLTGKDTQTLTLGSSLLDNLTDEEKKIATDKGWTLA